MLSTVSALSAQNIGAGKYDRAKQTLRYAILISCAFGVISVTVMQIAPEFR
ncbi:MAG: MATE family efflux transporter [Eubacterium sp.]|nr:MATE family efflux transporter [Eubacterium sp.]